MNTLSPSVSLGSTSLREIHETELASLQRCSGYPLVSVLAATTAGSEMTSEDQLAIGRLLTQAERRLGVDVGSDLAERITERLRRLVVDVLDDPMGRGLAVFVGADVEAVYRLPVTPVSRVVVDPSFATRDLALSLHDHPTFRVLVVTDSVARVFLTDALGCDEVVNASFPMSAPVDAHFDVARSARRICAALEMDTSTSSDPLIVFGPWATAQQIALLADGAVGVIDGVDPTPGIDELMLLARPYLAAAREQARERAFEKMDNATIRHHAAVGIDQVWRASLHGSVDLLLVDREFAYPASPGGLGEHLVAMTDIEAIGVLDDAVDEIIEMVTRCSGSVVFVDHGELGDDGIAAVLR